VPASPWTTVAIFFVVALVVATVIAIVSGIFTRKRPTKQKLEAYECGVPPTSEMLGRFPVHFFLVAMLFVVFAVEAASFFPWAGQLKALGFFGFNEMLTFIIGVGIG